MSAISKTIKAVREDENLQRNSYYVDLAEKAAVELAAMQEVIEAARELTDYTNSVIESRLPPEWALLKQLNAALAKLDGLK